jgi:hypothetical protein
MPEKHIKDLLRCTTRGQLFVDFEAIFDLVDHPVDSNKVHVEVDFYETDAEGRIIQTDNYGLMEPKIKTVKSGITRIRVGIIEEP